MNAASPGPGAPDDAAPWPGPFVRYDLVKEFVVALVAITVLAVVLTVLFSSPDYSADDDPELGAGRSRRLRGNRGHRAGRDQRDRDLRPALQPHLRRDAEDRPDRPAELCRRAHPDRHRQRLRDRPAEDDPRQPAAEGRARRLRGRAAGRCRKPGPTPTPRALPRRRFVRGVAVLPPRPLRPGRADDDRAARAGPERRARRRPARRAATASTRPTTPNRCSSSPPAATSRTAPPASTCSATSGA